MTTPREAAQAVIERWDAPMGSDLTDIGNCMDDLHKALEAPEQEPDVIAQPVQPAPDIKALQAEGKGPAPCARFCESNAFEIEIRNAAGKSQVLQAKCDAFFANTLLALEEIDDLTKERDALMAAGKLALEALKLIRRQLKDWEEGDNAITALKQAGVAA